MSQSPQCPHCHSELPDSFGLTKCPSCEQMVIVDFDGGVSLSDAESADIAATTPPNETFKPESFSAEEFDSPNVLPSEFGGEEQDLVQTVVHQPVTKSENKVADEPESDGWSLGDSVKEEAQDLPTRVISSDFDITEFANSKESEANEGGLFYDLLITGMDSPSSIAEVKEVLSDSRLKLDLIALFKSFKGGSIRIEKLNPVKVYVIVKGLMPIQVEVKWKQYSVLEVVP